MTSDATTRAEVLWAKGYRWEDVVGELRSEGFSKVDCIRATVDLLRIPLAEAKRLVHFSSTWSDVQARDDTFHFLAAAALAPPTSDAAQDDPTEASLTHGDVAQRLVGVVSALRQGDVRFAQTIIAELLDEEDADRILLLSGVLTAALAEMAGIGEENLVEALGILVATSVDSPHGDTIVAIARAEEALAAR